MTLTRRCFGRVLGMGAVAGALVGCGTGTGSRRARDLERELSGHPGLAGVMARAGEHRLQVLVSAVMPGRDGRVGLERHGFRVDAEYFYPASAIKLCAAVAGLQVLSDLGAGRGDLLGARVEIAPLFPGDVIQREDPASAGDARLPGVPIRFGREIRKLALVSDNPAFNRLFDLVGRDGLNRRMHAAGLASVAIHHRLSDPRSIPDPGASAAVTLFPGDGEEPVTVPARTSHPPAANPGPGLTIGRAHLRGSARVDEPMDFTWRNGISLRDLQDLLVQVARPDIDLGTPGLGLSAGHRAFLLEAMTQYPRESEDPQYPAASYPDAHAKFLLPGVRRVFPDARKGRRVEISAKIGRAYGFSVENSYLVNPVNGRAVFATAVLYTNADGVLNDDRYEYAEVADPFLADLGEWVARRWLT